MTPEQQHIAMSSHACDQANELQELHNRLAAAGDSLAGVPIRATELSRNAGVQTFGLYLGRADAEQYVAKSPCRDLRTHDLVRRDDVADVVSNLLERADVAEQHLAVISDILGTPKPLQIDDIAATARLLIVERDEARAEWQASERRALEYGDIVARHVAAMRAAVLAGDDGMRWIINTLAGPGFLPDGLGEHADAQAMFDAEVAEIDAHRAKHTAPEPVVGPLRAQIRTLTAERDAALAELELAREADHGVRAAAAALARRRPLYDGASGEPADEELAQAIEDLPLPDADVTNWRAEAERLRAEIDMINPQATIGVGDGSDWLFVHGSHEAVKRVQSRILEAERLRAELAKEKPECPPSP